MQKDDLIYRKDAIDYCYQLINVEHQQGSDEMNYGQERVNQTETILHHLEFMPSAQPEPKTGRWLSQVGGGYYCSKCGRYALHDVDEKFALLFTKSKYCPHCGAKMKGEDKG